MNEYKVFVCKHCGKIIEVFPNTHCCPTICCGEPMVELKANTTDAATEKHVPAVEVNGNTIHDCDNCLRAIELEIVEGKVAIK